MWSRQIIPKFSERKMRKGYFITFEGPEACGKTSQIPILAAELSAQGYRVYPLREPGGTQVGEEIRVILKKIREETMDPKAELLLFEAARAQLTTRLIVPALERGMVVISDRFFDSTLVYQGDGRGLNKGEIKWLNCFATGDLTPDLTFYLDISQEEGRRRRGLAREGWDRIEAEDLAFHQRVREGYLNIITTENDSGRWVLIDGEKPITEVREEIKRVTFSRLRQRDLLEGAVVGKERS